MNLLQTITAKGHFYFINSKRVSEEAFKESKVGNRLSCFKTKIDKKGNIRQYCIVSQRKI